MQNTIWYAGKLCGLVTVVEDLDEAQAILNAYRQAGKKACAIHKMGDARIYVEGC